MHEARDNGWESLVRQQLESLNLQKTLTMKVQVPAMLS